MRWLCDKHLFNRAIALSHWRCRLAVWRRNSSGRRWPCPTAGAALPESVQHQTRARSRFGRTWEAKSSIALIEKALAQNLDLEAALHRIEQARAQATVAGSALYPSIDASGRRIAYFPGRRIIRPQRAASAASVMKLTCGARIAISWPPRTTAPTPPSSIAKLCSSGGHPMPTTFYTQILSLNERIRIAQNNLNNAEEMLRIVEARFNEGSVSGLEVSQQRVAVNNFRAALTSLTEQRSTNLNAFAILLGQAPQNFTSRTADFVSLKMPEVNLTPPASLLTARPDIESAEAGLRAANADIGIARAAFFPSLTLGADTASRRDSAARRPRQPLSRRICLRRSLPAAGSPEILKMLRRDRKNWRRSIRKPC